MSPQQTAAHCQQFTMPSHNTPPQNVALWQPSAQTPQPFQQSPVAHKQQLLFQPPAPASQATHQWQGQPPFIQPRAGPQGQYIRQQRYSSPFMQNLNASAQSFIPAEEAQQNSVPNTQEPRVPKSADGKGVKKPAQQWTRCASDANSQDTSRRIALSCHTAPNVEPKVTSQRSALQRAKTSNNRMKDVKATKGLPKSIEKIGRRHKTSHTSQTQIIDVTTVQATTEPVTGQ